LEDIDSLCFPRIDLGFVRRYYYFIVEFVEPRLYIFEAPPLVMVVESAHNSWRYFALNSCESFCGINGAILLI
jgi:hypothetical protein